MNADKPTEYDFVIIGAGAAGEAAAHEAIRLGASVAVVERELAGGSCPFWACMPSKALLHAARVHNHGGKYPWSRASDFRDWMINREDVDSPSDQSHVKSLEDEGAEFIRGNATITAPGTVRVTADGQTDRVLRGRSLIAAVGSRSTIPHDLPGIDDLEPWTNRQATTARELPKSLLILGGGPTGVELAQVYARYGVPVTLIHPENRLNHRDHPRNSEVLKRTLEADGVDIHLEERAEALIAGRDGAAHTAKLSSGATATGHEVLFAIGRTNPLADLGLESIGVKLHKGRVKPDDQLRIAPDTYVVGDPAGPEMHTHLAHYQGEMAVHIARGEDVRPDYTAIPRAIYTEPETAGVGMLLEEARKQGLDVFEEWTDLEKSAKGYVTESFGHATVVVDRASRRLVGAFIAGPGAAEAIHEAVLAIKAGITIDVLADTIHAFPTTSRVLGTVFVQAARRMES